MSATTSCMFRGIIVNISYFTVGAGTSPHNKPVVPLFLKLASHHLAMGGPYLLRKVLKNLAPSLVFIILNSRIFSVHVLVGRKYNCPVIQVEIVVKVQACFFSDLRPML